MIISHRTSHFLGVWRNRMQSEVDAHSNDRMSKPYWINDMLQGYTKYVRRAAKEAGIKMAKNTSKFKWNGYVNVNIPSSQMNAAEKFMDDDKAVFAAFGEMVVEGYKIAVRYDESQQAYVATATCFDPDSPNHGYALSAFGGDWYLSVACCIFKHYEITRENWTEFSSKPTGKFG